MKNQEQDQQNQGLPLRNQTNPGFWKTLFSKRWTFPVIYLGAAALIVGLTFAQLNVSKPNSSVTPQDGNSAGQADTATKDTSKDATAANATQTFAWPVGADGSDAKVTMSFYDDTKDEATRAKSMVELDGNKFYPQPGIVIGLPSDKPFTVIAAAKGEVTKVDTDPLMGTVIEIDNGNGYKTYYASLSSPLVKVGDKVIMGQEIAKTSNNRFEKDQLNHLHFEIKKDGKNIDPMTMLEPRK